MKPTIGIPDHDLKEVATLLNTLLADEYVLFTKTRNAHWNVEGQNFMELHKFFESQYEQLDIIIDDVAERIRAVGHYSNGSLRQFLENTHSPKKFISIITERRPYTNCSTIMSC